MEVLDAIFECIKIANFPFKSSDANNSLESVEEAYSGACVIVFTVVKEKKLKRKRNRQR